MSGPAFLEQLIKTRDAAQTVYEAADAALRKAMKENDDNANHLTIDGVCIPMKFMWHQSRETYPSQDTIRYEATQESQSILTKGPYNIEGQVGHFLFQANHVFINADSKILLHESSMTSNRCCILLSFDCKDNHYLLTHVSHSFAGYMNASERGTKQCLMEVKHNQRETNTISSI
jgi:hypothetical protein